MHNEIRITLSKMMRTARFIICLISLSSSGLTMDDGIYTSCVRNVFKNVSEDASHIVSSKDVTFYLNRDETTKTIDTFDLDEVGGKPIKFIIHGWTDNAHYQWILSLREAFYRTGDFDVILVDWSGPASKRYPVSSRSTRGAGNILGDFIANIYQRTNLLLENYHIVGHSLGAHVAGFAGKKVQQRTGSKILKITGLDPAGPLFEFPTLLKREDRLSDNDAEIVEIVHTDGARFGFAQPLGTIDFYANSGMGFQPNCYNVENFFDLLCSIGCSHQKSHEYYLYAVDNCGIPAASCQSWNMFKSNACDGNKIVLLGTEMAKNVVGIYFFEISL